MLNKYLKYVQDKSLRFLLHIYDICWWFFFCVFYHLCQFGPAGDIQLPSKIMDAMQMQVEAERKKRASILESEGQRDAAINKAEGIKQRQILESEGHRVETVNSATG